MAKTKKKRNKKYDPSKMLHRSVTRQSGKYFIAHSWLAKASYFYDRKGNPVRPPQHVVDNVKFTPMQWAVSCLVIARDKNGKDKIRVLDVGVPRHPDVIDGDGNFLREGDPIPTKYVDLAPAFCEAHLEFVKEYTAKSPETYMGYGWVCSPAGEEVDEDLLWKIMEWQGVWKEKAPWEVELEDALAQDANYDDEARVAHEKKELEEEVGETV